MQKTIRLSSDVYRLNNGVVEVLIYDDTIGINPEYDDPEYDRKISDLEYDRLVWRKSKYTVGRAVVLFSRTDVSPNAIRAGQNTPAYDLSFDLGGISGNLNPSIKQTTGWRGTTDDVSIDAHGIVRITKISALKNGDISVTVKTSSAH